ncbi:hypothetical protein LXL04_001428 [Taraxacum kok-saghyz]
MTPLHLGYCREGRTINEELLSADVLSTITPPSLCSVNATTAVLALLSRDQEAATTLLAVSSFTAEEEHLHRSTSCILPF